MAQRRCLYSLTRQAIRALSSNPSPFHLKSTLPSFHFPEKPIISRSFFTFNYSEKAPISHFYHRYFSSDSKNQNEDNESDGEEEDEEESDYEDEDDDVAIGSEFKKDYTPEEKEAEAESIGYKVIGPLGENELINDQYLPVFAVIQIGSHQFKVSSGDCIFTERLKFCDINDKLILNKVLLLGSQTQTIVGRPMVPDAVVHAIVEQHALDEKVIIFKKKRRKNYRRTKGHRQELTKLRIIDIEGIEKPLVKKPETKDKRPKKPVAKKQEKVPVAA